MADRHADSRIVRDSYNTISSLRLRLGALGKAQSMDSREPALHAATLHTKKSQGCSRRPTLVYFIIWLFSYDNGYSAPDRTGTSTGLSLIHI